MNSSIFSVGKWQIVFASFALCAMILAPLAYVKAQAAPQGTLIVQKEVVGTTTSPSNFSFLINGASSTPFEADGSNQLTLQVGQYQITEAPVAGFVTTYQGCEEIHLSATTTSTCTITNTATSTGTTTPPATGTLTVNKVIVGTTTASADDFSFLINGASSTPFEVDGSNQVTLALGTYDITEAQVSGYTTIYAGCQDVLVSATNSPVCTITNTATSTGTTTPPATGTLVVNKVVNGGTAATSSFSFRINGGATTTFESDGTNVVTGLATGTYAVTEVPTANYTPTYTNCTSAVITAHATTTCTITNNFNVGGAQLYEITGIVWDDEDEDGVLDGGESFLQNWMVSASQTGEITRTDTTDANGRYTLLVTDGQWLVSQSSQPDWDQTFPAGGTHTVTATGTATSTIPLGDYNFGNDRDVTSSGGGGGNGVRIELRDDDDDDDEEDDDDSNSGGGRTDDDDDDSGGTPSGQVLGEQTSVFPYGAPNTGFGGGDLKKMDGTMTLPLLSMVMVMLIGFGVTRALREEEEGEGEAV